MNTTVIALDLTRRKYAYDGHEPDWNVKIPVPLAAQDFAFSFAEIANQPLVKLQSKLGSAAFDKIVEMQGYRIPKGEFEVFTGEDDLPLYYYLRPDNSPDAVKLVIVSMGEYQPCRYIAHVEGIWRATGADYNLRLCGTPSPARGHAK